MSQLLLYSSLCCFTASFTSREVLGKGSFGYVYKQYDKLSKQYVACKEVDLGLVTEAGHEKVFFYLCDFISCLEV